MDVPSHAEVVEQIDGFLDRTGMKPSRLGRDAIGEPQFVAQVRDGRVPTLKTLEKLLSFMREREAEGVRLTIAGQPTPGRARSHRLNGGAR